jgi:hypothetical protein
MLERLRRHGRLTVVAIAVAALVVVGAIALDRGGPHDPCEGPSAARPAETALMPAALSFDRIGTVTRVRRNDRHLIVHAVTTRPIDQITVLLQDAVTAAGYRPAGMDNEGFEAEVFFSTDVYAAGQALVRRSACEGRWDITLVLLDLRPGPSPTTTP